MRARIFERTRSMTLAGSRSSSLDAVLLIVS
jgi:hypothetical protein